MSYFVIIQAISMDVTVESRDPEPTLVNTVDATEGETLSKSKRLKSTITRVYKHVGHNKRRGGSNSRHLL